MPVSLGIMSLFDCVKDDPTGDYYMEMEPYIKCYTFAGTWGRLVIPAIAFFILYVIGIPFTMYIAARMTKNQTNESSVYYKVNLKIIYRTYIHS